MENAKKKICTVFQALDAVLLVVMVVINVIQVLCRYFISYSFIWAEDLSIYMLHWIVCFSAPMCWLRKDHMIMDVADSIFPRKVLNFFAILVEFVGVAFGIYLAHRGLYAARINKGYVLSVLRYDEMWKYIPYAVMGVLLSLAALWNLIEYYKAWKDGRKEGIA